MELLGDLTMEKILSDIIERDSRDSNREIAPLIPQVMRKVLDTDNLSIEQVVNKITTLLKKHLSEKTLRKKQIPLTFIINRTDAIGDLVLTLPVAQRFKEKFPNCSIVNDCIL